MEKTFVYLNSYILRDCVLQSSAPAKIMQEKTPDLVIK